MTTKIKYIRLGFIRSAHALSGEVELHLDISGEFLDSFPPQIYLRRSQSVSHFYLSEDSSLESCEVEKVRPFKKGALVKLKGSNDRESAENLIGMLVYFNTQDGDFDSSYLFWFLGFEVFRGDTLENLGVISHFQSHSHQDLMVVEKGEKKIEIPFISDYIEKIDKENKQLILNLPDFFPGVD